MPEHFEVANAVGAVTGLIVQGCEVLVSRPDSGFYRVHLTDGPVEVRTWHQALELAKKSAANVAKDNAQRAGAAKRVLRRTRKPVYIIPLSGQETETGNNES